MSSASVPNNPVPPTPMPASANFEKLKSKLRELFELDKADLDFGIYRILRQRHNEITEFLDRHLEKTVREALEGHQTGQRGQLEEDLRKAETAAQAAGISPEQSPRVAELRAKLAASASLDEVADEVYSHLYTFFSRYYQEGDFLGLQRSTVRGREKYMIPYNGEEVKMVWANMDQYYIKSSELLRDYRFDVRPKEGALFAGSDPNLYSVEFKLIEGDTEKDNRKPDGKTARAFQLDGEKTFEEVDSTCLRIRFRFSEQASERNLQDKLNADTLKTLADTLPSQWRVLLFAAAEPADAPTKDKRTVLEKHLRAYTARHQFDYFIHKNLGGFLLRELDFYVKNEVMYLDDIEDASAAKAEEYLSKLRAVRRCAMPVIRMLAQIEDFQKKLWLKKKFVVETRYCVTLDRIPEDLYGEICQNDAQWAEWEELYSLSERPKDLFTAAPKTIEFLKLQPSLMVDTKHFSPEFLYRLLATVDDLGSWLGGICFHSENFQALRLMETRFRDVVKCVYIDPPYNTSSSSIPYKNNYRHSSWGTMMLDRLALLHRMLRRDGAIFVSIDKLERTILESALDSVFGPQNKVEELIWSMNTNNSQAPNYSTNHEYVEVYAADRPVAEQDKGMFREPKPGYEEVMAFITKLNPQFPSLSEVESELRRLYERHKIEFREEIEAQGLEWDDEKGNDPWKGLYNYSHAEYRDKTGSYVDQSAAREKGATIWIYQEDNTSMPATKQSASTRQEDHPNWRFYKPPHPTTGRLCPHPKSGWKFAYADDEDSPDKKSFVSLDRDHRIAWGPDETKVPRLKRMLHEVETNIGKSVFQDYSDGEKQTSGLFGRSGVFLAPKHSSFVARFIQHAAKLDSIVVDCFGGSGSTAHAVVQLNREDHGSRKYVTVEVGHYFESVIVPRLKKVIFSGDWRNGRPVKYDSGISHAFKVVRLESYEDALNNLLVRRGGRQAQALATASDAQRDEYMLGYFLDVETTGSPSLLDTAQFRDPFSYQLQIATRTAGETKPTTIDLVETFNWLIGLNVKHIDHKKGFVMVTGEKRDGGRTLIVWRTLSDDPVADNEALHKYLDRISVNPADTEFAFIYVNGSHTLEDPHKKIHLIEEEFHLRMFESESFESLS
jgi:adenine-specific DNA-methyltransferase